MEKITYIIIGFLCLYALADISVSVISFKTSQVGYAPQQIAFMNALVSENNEP